jgi:hypothetical protein
MHPLDLAREVRFGLFIVEEKFLALSRNSLINNSFLLKFI